MALENFVQYAIPRFDGHYDYWSMLMENFLRYKEYWLVVVSGVAKPAARVVLTEPQRAELEALKLKDLKAKNYLFQAIDLNLGDDSLQRYLQAYLGFNEEKISGAKAKGAPTSTS